MALSDPQKAAVIERIGGIYEQNVFQRATVYLDCLEQLPTAQQTEAFELMLTMTDDDDAPKSGRQYNVPGLSNQVVDKLKPGLGKLVDGTLHFHVNKRPEPPDLAASLLPLVLGQSTRDEKIFALGWILADKIVPYRRIPLGGVRMGDDEYGATLERLKEKSKQIDAILRWPNLQATEAASLILGVITNNTTDEEQAVLLAHHMRALQRESVHGLLKRLM